MFTLSTQNLTQDYSNVTFHHSRLMGVSDIKNAVSITFKLYKMLHTPQAFIIRFAFSQDALIDVAVGLGAPLNKLILNMPAFGNSFNLMDQDKNLPGSSVTGLPQTTTYQQVTITTVILLDNQPEFLNPFLPCFSIPSQLHPSS